MTTPIGSASPRTTPPLALVRAYGVAPRSPATPSPSAAAPGGAASVGSARAATLRRVDTLVGEARIDIAAKIGPASSSKTEALVAAKVPGRVDFASTGSAGERAASAGAPMPFYRAPSDRNEAATAIMIGRGLDITG